MKWVCMGAVLFLAVWAVIVIMRKREKSKKKIREMSREEKLQRLDALLEPLGFSYVASEDIITLRLDAWQKKQGYEAHYDKAAIRGGMVLDVLPVYFDYHGDTWLIEFWKGQYGIHTGGAVGVYHAGKIIPKEFYTIAHFEAVSQEQMPCICCRLDRKRRKVYFLQKRHWHLTGFRMGTFARVSDLTLVVTLRFEQEEMAQSFYAGLQQAKGKIFQEKYRICRANVYVRLDRTQKRSFGVKLVQSMVQGWNWFRCVCYRLLTYPFVWTPERVLFLQEQLPWCFREKKHLTSTAFMIRYSVVNKDKDG